jgi:ketosteroid isomerase-like protein
LAAAGDFWREWLRCWETYRAQVDEYRELDDERVLVIGRMAGLGRRTGANVVAAFVNVVHLRDGKVVKLVMYPNRESALVDLGRSAEPDDNR